MPATAPGHPSTRSHDRRPGVKHDGRITLAGRKVFAAWDVTGLRRRVGMVFQRSNPFPKSVYENVAFGPRVNGITDRRKLDEIVEELREFFFGVFGPVAAQRFKELRRELTALDQCVENRLLQCFE